MRSSRAEARTVFITAAVLASLTFPAFLPGSAAPSANDAATWKAGVARAVITPEEPIWLSGYAHRDRPAEGKIHDLFVKALALEDAAGHTAVLVTSDLLGFPRKVANRICRAIGKRYRIDRSRVILTCSHTHSGPVLSEALIPCYPLDANGWKKIDRYTERLERIVVSTVGEALSRRVPARVSFGGSTAAFAVNRRNNREPDVPGLLAKGVALKGPVDHSVPVLAVRGADGSLMAIAFGYACHNTNLCDYQWCGDYAGFAQIAVEKQHPGAAAMFWIGCGADQNPLPRRSLPLCKQYGERLARAVERALAAGMEPVSPELSIAFNTVALKLDPFRDRAEIEALAKSKSVIDRRWAAGMLADLDAGKKLPEEYPYPVQALRLGGKLTWIVLGGEVVVDYALRFKRTFGESTWVTGYANDVMAYIPSLRIQKEGGYEAGAMHVYGLSAKGWARDVEERVAAAVRRLVDEASRKLATRKVRACLGGKGGPAVSPAWIALPPGAVRPGGWLADWARAAADGITGHLDERTATFREGWSGKDFKAMGAREQGTGWPLEQCSYWLDGLVRLAYILEDDALIRKVRARLDPVVDGVLRGGPSLIYWRPKSQLNAAFDNWAHSHMGRALVAYYEATGEQRVLDALVRAYRDYPLPDLNDHFHGVCGAVNVDPMLDVYTLSGDRKVLERALSLTERPSYRKAVARWGKGDVDPGHNVIFYENIRVPAWLYPWTGNRNDLDATLGALRWNDQHHLLPVGVSSGEEFHAGIGSTRNIETCDVPVSMWTYLGLLRMTGRGEYGDRVERIFFNAGPAPIARDFQTMCYYQSPNRLSTSLPRDEPRAPGPGCYRFTPIGHRVLCCVGNCNRILPFYIQHMWMAAPEGGLAAALYGPCRLRAEVAGNVPVTVDCRTAYPFEETVRMTVEPESDVRFALHLRVPSWCAAPAVSVNGNDLAVQPDARGLLQVLRTWRRGDRVTLRLPMAPRITRETETPYPAIPYFSRGRELARVKEVHNPCATVTFGPLLFALPIADENPNKPAPGARWNYALEAGASSGALAADVVRSPMPARWSWQLEAPVKLRVKARRFDWHPTELQPLPPSPVQGGESTTIALVPYGCTKFRVSMFPVAGRRNEARSSREGRPPAIHRPAERRGGNKGIPRASPLIPRRAP